MARTHAVHVSCHVLLLASARLDQGRHMELANAEERLRQEFEGVFSPETASESSMTLQLGGGTHESRRTLRCSPRGWPESVCARLHRQEVSS